jgi:hypothetical protein
MTSTPILETMLGSLQDRLRSLPGFQTLNPQPSTTNLSSSSEENETQSNLIEPRKNNFMHQKFGQLGKQTVNFVPEATPMTKTFVGNFVDASSPGHHVCNFGASEFFRHYSFALRHSPHCNPAPVQFDLLTIARVSSNPPVRLAPASSSFQSNQSGPNSTKPELSGANWTKTAFWLAAARSTRSTNGKARIA